MECKITTSLQRCDGVAPRDDERRLFSQPAQERALSSHDGGGQCEHDTVRGLHNVHYKIDNYIN